MSPGRKVLGSHFFLFPLYTLQCSAVDILVRAYIQSWASSFSESMLLVPRFLGHNEDSSFSHSQAKTLYLQSFLLGRCIDFPRGCISRKVPLCKQLLLKWKQKPVPWHNALCFRIWAAPCATACTKEQFFPCAEGFAFKKRLWNKDMKPCPVDRWHPYLCRLWGVFNEDVLRISKGLPLNKISRYLLSKCYLFDVFSVAMDRYIISARWAVFHLEL